MFIYIKDLYTYTYTKKLLKKKKKNDITPLRFFTTQISIELFTSLCTYIYNSWIFPKSCTRAYFLNPSRIRGCRQRLRCPHRRGVQTPCVFSNQPPFTLHLSLSLSFSRSLNAFEHATCTTFAQYPQWFSVTVYLGLFIPISPSHIPIHLLLRPLYTPFFSRSCEVVPSSGVLLHIYISFTKDFIHFENFLEKFQTTFSHFKIKKYSKTNINNKHLSFSSANYKVYVYKQINLIPKQL